MKLDGQSLLLRIFTGEIDKIGHRPLYEAIVRAAKEEGIAGATVIRGLMSYGASSIIHTARLIDISEDLPIVIEIVDKEEKIHGFIPRINALMKECGRGGLITLEKVQVLYYQPRPK